MAIIRTIEGGSADFSPQTSNSSEGGGRLAIDPSGNLLVRGPIHTDESSFRFNFSGSALSINIGSCTFTNGSVIVTGTAFDTYEIHNSDFIKLVADAATFYATIGNIDSPTQITLESPYGGTSATGATESTILQPIITSDGSFAVTRGSGIMTCGTISGGIYSLERFVDVLPITKTCSVSVSQRPFNQETLIGFYDNQHGSTTPYYYAWFRLVGGNKNSVITETGHSRSGIPTAFEIESNTIILPNNLTTDQQIRYRIEVNNDKIRFLVNSIVIAEHFKILMPPYNWLTSTIGARNLGTVPSVTTINMDYDGVQNYNQVITGVQNSAEPAPVATGDMETLIDLVNVLVSKTAVADTLGRGRVVLDATGSTIVTATNLSTNIAQVGATTILTNNGVAGAGAVRVAIASDTTMPNTPGQTVSYQLGMNNISIGATLPIIFNAILVS